MPTMLTADHLEERQDQGTFYTGPLQPAKDFMARHDYATAVSEKDGTHTVLIGYDGTAVTWDNCADFGRAKTPEDAWRFALGAAYGPADDEFQPLDLDS